MTTDDRLGLIETRLNAIEQVTGLFRRGLSDDGRVPYLMLAARLGILTDYWQKKPFGQGAALAVGTAIDRFAIYAEIDEEACPDHPSVAVYASCVPASVSGQPHLAFEGAVGNAPENYGLHLTFGARAIGLRAEGIELVGDYMAYLIGKIGGVIKQLW